MRVLQECNRESFYQRCLPFSTILGVGTFMGVKSGFFQPSAKFGPTPKVLGAVVIGYFLGKISYQAKCAEKLMAVPDSKIGAMLRSRKYGGQTDSLIMEDHELEKAVSSMPESEKYSDISAKNQLDMDLDRPLFPGLDDYRPNFDDVRIGDDAFLPPSGSRTTSYDELRRRNREEFEQKRTKAYRGVMTPEEVPSGLKVEDQSPLDKKENPPMNIYGDIWGK